MRYGILMVFQQFRCELTQIWLTDAMFFVALFRYRLLLTLSFDLG